MTLSKGSLHSPPSRDTHLDDDAYGITAALRDCQASSDSERSGEVQFPSNGKFRAKC